jgi:hypothetical protein
VDDCGDGLVVAVVVVPLVVDVDRFDWLLAAGLFSSSLLLLLMLLSYFGSFDLFLQ